MEEKTNYVIEQIDETSWIIADDFVRMLLFAGTNIALLVDSGLGSGDLKKTIAGLTRLPVILVNTHADYDHICGNSQFDVAYMHPSEFAHYRSELAEFKLSEGRRLEVSPLLEGDIIDIGGRCFEAILIPGHTPGSIALLDAENRILLGGDSVLDDRIAMVNQWRDFEAYIYSIERLIRMSDRFDVIYAPHGSFSLDADFLSKLLIAARRCQNGEIEGVDTDFIKGAKLYDAGAAKFLF